MLVYQNKKIIDKRVADLLEFISEDDVLVFNDARVIKAKLSGIINRNQAAVEFNLTQEIAPNLWQVLIKPAKKVRVGDEIVIAPGLSALILTKREDGSIEIEFDEKNRAELLRKIEQCGAIPLPPYLKRSADSADDQDYQTIYSKKKFELTDDLIEGLAFASPTAGLHFDAELLAKIKAKQVLVSLNVGAGTFLPVKAERISQHVMHREFFSISEEAAEIINEAKARKKRIIAVGTTSLRALESAADEKGRIAASSQVTNIFIHPPYQFKIVDALFTNFHLPKSTLFMLVCALVGKEEAFRIYQHAIDERYRFYSYGDASFLEVVRSRS